eukprot:CAMPEP_0178390734 /NCGR_PEP_ID=MMETSP0689_2-20121128/10798_1 /TAXON_ID=160604 /ORGANISM="Amphidinium massartii, Strain CS-259" /LENGTH=353 /DNA_ID=CAMNT_0020011251 /DNA_START=66 /DNA_END=1124 /DNA_ORIENTATION=-
MLDVPLPKFVSSRGPSGSLSASVSNIGTDGFSSSSTRSGSLGSVTSTPSVGFTAAGGAVALSTPYNHPALSAQCAHCDQTSAVHETLNQEHQQQAVNLSAAAKAKASAQEARHRLSSPGPIITRAELETWIQASERLKDPDLALALLHYLLETHEQANGAFMLQGDLCASLLAAFCKGGRPDLALTWFDFMSCFGPEPTTDMVCWQITALVKTKCYGKAGQSFHGLRCRGSIPNITAYNALIGACSKDGSGLPVALCFLRNMVEDCVEPCMITFNALIGCVERSAGISAPQAQQQAGSAEILLRCMEDEQIVCPVIVALARQKLAQKSHKGSRAGHSNQGQTAVTKQTLHVHP